ncbi:MAG: hypothetical protein KDJ36_12325 [Hyphomicrobiaceae bacterium]|nr:hypothetical protein [Hyphomicrobiaceae bacterium]
MNSKWTNTRRGEFTEDRRGSVATLAAVTLPIVLGAAALAVDIGILYLDRRHMQGAVDLAATAAAAEISQAERLAKLTLSANGVPAGASLSIVKGNYLADPSVVPAKRFQPNVAPFNAVKVSLVSSSPRYFGRLFGTDDLEVHVSAIGTSSSQAAFSAGSRLAAVRDGLPNALIGALTGSSVNMTVMDYEALLAADIRLATFLDALATRLGISAGTYDDVLKSSATVEDVLEAAVTVTQGNGNASAASALRLIAQSSKGHKLSVPLSQLINLGPYANAAIGHAPKGMTADLNAMDLVSSALAIANGDKQLSLDLKADIPGLIRATLVLGIGERPVQSGWVSVGGENSQVETAQLRLRLVVELAGSGALSGVTVRLPIELQLAHARARLASVSCSGGKQVAIAATPGIVSAWIGDRNETAGWWRQSLVPAKIVDTSVLKVLGRAQIMAERQTQETLVFSSSDIAERVVKRANTNSYLSSLASTLLSKLELEANVIGISSATPDLAGTAAKQVLNTAAAPIDKLLYEVLSVLGVSLGEVDIRVHAAQCGGATLAQ